MDRQNNYNQPTTNSLSVFTHREFVPFLAVNAELSPQTTNVAGPQHRATGNVTNQRRVLQGSYPVNTYGGGISCSGTFNGLSPLFILGSNNWDDDPENFAGYNATLVYLHGFQLPLTGRLNRGLFEQKPSKNTR